jgi:2-phospho-L-lactate guanylyltransferase
MNRAVALVPVKPPAASKSRLAPVLSDADRMALSIRLLEHVLAALQGANSVDTCWVLGGDEHVAALAARRNARWLPELGRDLNDTLAHALMRLPAEVTAALILPMDLPFLTGQSVNALVARLAEDQADVVIAPDRWKRGTNALLLTRSLDPPQDRPFVLRPAFGPNSLIRHQEAARSQGLRVALHHAKELAFDIDTPADLAGSGLFVRVQENT